MKPLADEYQRLSADVQKVIGQGAMRLTAAQEADNQQDPLINQSTGWDAGLLALAATADQQTTPTGLGSDVLYALFRTGLPTDIGALASVPPSTVGSALAKANEAGIVTLSVDQIAAAQSTFASFAIDTNLEKKVVGAPSSFGELLGNVVSNPAQRAAFAAAFFDPTVSSADLWNKAAIAGILPEQISALQQQGKLSFLTVNNADLIQKIQSDLGPTSDLGVLVDRDFHKAKTWENAITSLAGNDPAKLESLIPTTYAGNTTADRLAAYSTDLARKVGFTYPTRTVARMAETGDLKLGQGVVAPEVAAFLRAADSAGFQLGRTPWNRFLNILPAFVPSPPDPGTIAQVKTLHRLFQITPNHESLQAVLNLGFTSVHEIASVQPEEFSARFGSSFASRDEANLVYNNAQQVARRDVCTVGAAESPDVSPAPATAQIHKD